jgi:hypothetical protein
MGKDSQDEISTLSEGFGWGRLGQRPANERQHGIFGTIEEGGQVLTMWGHEGTGASSGVLENQVLSSFAGNVKALRI